MTLEGYESDRSTSIPIEDCFVCGERWPHFSDDSPGYHASRVIQMRRWFSEVRDLLLSVSDPNVEMTMALREECGAASKELMRLLEEYDKAGG